MDARRVVIRKHGGPEVMVMEEAPLGKLAPGHLRVEATHCGVNWADVMMRMGLYPEAPKPPFTPGYEVVGHVAEVGEGLDGWKVGDPVIAGTKFGGYASAVDVLPGQAFKRPKALAPEVACALPVQGITAWAALVGHGRIRKGDRVLVHGGAGGVGIMAIHIAQRHGAEVFATVGSQDKIQFLQDEYGVQGFLRDSAWHKDMQAAGGADIVLDAVGGEHLQQSRRSLAPYGKVVSYGLSAAVTGHRRNVLTALGAMRHMKMDVLKLMMRNVGVSGLNVLTLQDQTDVAAGLEEIAMDIVRGRMPAPRIDEIFELSDAGQAHMHLQARKNRGKVLLRAD